MTQGCEHLTDDGMLTPILPKYYVLKMLSALYVCCMYSYELLNSLTMNVNQKPDDDDFGTGVNSLPIECCLLITFANSLDPGHAWQNIWHLICLAIRWYS